MFIVFCNKFSPSFPYWILDLFFSISILQKMLVLCCQKVGPVAWSVNRETKAAAVDWWVDPVFCGQICLFGVGWPVSQLVELVRCTQVWILEIYKSLDLAWIIGWLYQFDNYGKFMVAGFAVSNFEILSSTLLWNVPVFTLLKIPCVCVVSWQRLYSCKIGLSHIFQVYRCADILRRLNCPNRIYLGGILKL